MFDAVLVKCYCQKKTRAAELKDNDLLFFFTTSFFTFNPVMAILIYKDDDREKEVQDALKHPDENEARIFDLSSSL